MTDSVSVCNRALQQVGTRTTVTDLNEGSWEANNFKLIYDDYRKQVLRMARWNFARKTANLQLIKAAPGTPETQATTYTQWINAFPAPPWLYEYWMPPDCLFMRYIIPPSSPQGFSIPLFSTTTATYSPLLNGPPQPFVKTTDNTGLIQAISSITNANPGVVAVADLTGWNNGDTVLIRSVAGMIEVNNLQYTLAGKAGNTFSLGVNTTGYGTYVQDGIAINVAGAQQRNNVILCDAQQAIGVYTMDVTDLNLWEPDAVEALVAICASGLVNPLSGDKKLKQEQVTLANDIIRSARANDANEGYTVLDSVPDWIAARGGEYNISGGGYTAPYPSLFRIP